MGTLRILASRSLLSSRLPRLRTSEQTKRMMSASNRTTADKSDIQFHGKHVSIWWDPLSQMRALHAFNPLRIQLVIDGLANIGGLKSEKAFPSLEGIKVVDVGCGGGILSEGLARVGADVTGIDASEDLIQLAKTHAETDPRISSKINYVRALVEEFAPENEGTFDAVVASEVIEHVADPPLFVENCVKVLKPGGSIFITTPNRTFVSWLAGIIIAENILSILPKGTHDWHKFLSPEETQRLLQACDCNTKLVHGLTYNPMTNAWSWTKNTKLAYAIHAVKSNKQS